MSGTHNIDDLVRLLRHTAHGGSLTEADVANIRWSSDDPIIDNAANDAWLSLRLYDDDSDIRARDKEYERALQRALLENSDELIALRNGQDPRRRRYSFLRRLLWRAGIVG